MYEIQINNNYDFKKESYSTHFPNLHKYPATMLPQIGIELFKELKIGKNKLLDPYCGTGSSALAGIAVDFSEFYGFDINPLAILISKARYERLNIKKLFNYRESVEEAVYYEKDNILPPFVTNIHFWFSKRSIKDLSVIRNSILEEVENEKYQALFWLAFSETVRFVSYTRNSEFKLYRMPEEKRKSFNPDTFDLFFKNLDKILNTYIKFYLPLLNKQKFYFYSKEFEYEKNKYDVVLTSPPYGDSRTTVAYGQFSTLSSEWIGFPNSRKIDSKLMGGKKVKTLYDKGVLSESIKKIDQRDSKRALEVSSFYIDLEKSIKEVSQAITSKGFSIYVVGNRTVKNITLATDQFIAEQFEKNGFRHILTYERAISSKVMPSQNSPTNIAGKKVNTMHKEYIIVCRKF
ncbi:MAG: modification methylase [Oligoflexia bacterium]|nr:modification methylase [Oligoflexia bacterium]